MKKLLLLLLFIAIGVANTHAQEPSKAKIMTFNIRNCMGMDGKVDYERVAGIITNSQAQIIALQEVDSLTARSSHTDVLKQLGELTGMNYTYSKAINYDGGGYGIGLLSVEKPKSILRLPLPGSEEKRTLLLAEFDKCYVAATHFSLTESDQIKSIEIIAELMRNYSDKPFFVAGDLNFKPLSQPHKQFSRLFNILTPAWQHTYFGDDGSSECIDYIAIGRESEFCAANQSFTFVSTPVASDHRPIMVDVSMGKLFRTEPYLLNAVNGEVTVCWQLNAPSYSWVEYGEDSTELDKRAHTLINGQAMSNNVDNKIILSDIRAGVKYYYRVCSNQITSYKPYSKEFAALQFSKTYSFCLPKGDDFTAVVFNDLHQNSETLSALVSMLQDKGINYHYVIYNGDCVDDPNTRDEVIRTLERFNAATRAHSVPSLFIRGNHEIRGAYSLYLDELLAYPNGGKSYGSFTVGKTRFVLLDSGEDKSDEHWVYYGLNDFDGWRRQQREFLRCEVESLEFRKAKSRVLIHHIPIYGQKDDEKNLATPYWSDILDKASFTVAINAHNHEFKTIARGKAGNNFPVIVGGGPAKGTATVTVLQSRAGKLDVFCLDAQGDKLFIMQR